MAALKRAVQVVGDPGQIAQILQQREEREEDRHGRQHHRRDPGQHPPGPVDQQPAPEVREAQRGDQRVQAEFDPSEQSRERVGEGVGPENAEIQDQRQEEQHQRIAEPAAGEQPVDGLVSPGLCVVALPYNTLTESGGAVEKRGGDGVLVGLGRQPGQAARPGDRTVDQRVQSPENRLPAAFFPGGDADDRDAQPL